MRSGVLLCWQECGCKGLDLDAWAGMMLCIGLSRCKLSWLLLKQSAVVQICIAVIASFQDGKAKFFIRRLARTLRLKAALSGGE